MRDNNQTEFASKITDGVNGNIFNQKEFNEAMSTEHRTLQQNFTRMCLGWMEHLAELPDNRVDLRNKASVETAKKLMKRFQDGEEDWAKGFKPSQFLPTI